VADADAMKSARELEGKKMSDDIKHETERDDEEPDGWSGEAEEVKDRYE